MMVAWAPTGVEKIVSVINGEAQLEGDEEIAEVFNNRYSMAMTELRPVSSALRLRMREFLL